MQLRTRLPLLLVSLLGLGFSLALAQMRFEKPAVSPTELASAVPSGMIVAFATSCPSGWAEYTAARGLYLVGTLSSGTVAATVGTALTDQENRPTGQHTHLINTVDDGADHGRPDGRHIANSSAETYLSGGELTITLAADTVANPAGSGAGPPQHPIGEFPNRHKNEVLSTISIEAGDIGTEPTIPETIAFGSVVRKTQAQRELIFQLKKRRKIQRHFSWVSPQSALVSEPLDVDTLSYETINHKRGFSGYCPEGSTTTSVVLDRLATLEAGTYVLIVRHLADNTTERTTLSTGAGTWGLVAPTTPLATAPATGDVWSIGLQSVHQVDIRIERIQRNDDGTQSIEASQDIPGVYDPEDPPLTTAIPAAVGNFPIPLRAVSVSEGVTTDAAGTITSYCRIQVTPGLDVSAGTDQGGGSNSIDLCTDEPAIDDYFNSLTVVRIAGTGVGQQKPIIDYTGGSRRSVVSSPWTTPPYATSEYVVTFTSYDEFQGFDVEAYFVSAVPGQPVQYSVIASTQGTTLYLPSRTQPEVLGWRIVPYGRTGGLNRQGVFSGKAVAQSDVAAIAAAASSAEEEVQSAEQRRLLEQILITLQEQTALLQQVVKRKED